MEDDLNERQGGIITRILASRMQRSSQSLGEVSAKITLLCKTNRSLTLFQAKCLAKPRKMRRSQILYTTLLDIQLNQTEPKGGRSYDSHFPPYIAEVQFASVLLFYVQIICPSLRNLKKNQKNFITFQGKKLK